jgi:MoxR-like ATPase
MDRFLMRLSLGYPDIAKEQEMAHNYVEGVFDEELTPVIKRDEVIKMRKEVKDITVSSEIIDYVVQIITATRSHKSLSLGGSPRATLALINAARGCAYVAGRNYVIPDDVKKVVPHVLCHRITLTVEAKMNHKDAGTIITSILERIRVPI